MNHMQAKIDTTWGRKEKSEMQILFLAKVGVK